MSWSRPASKTADSSLPAPTKLLVSIRNAAGSVEVNGYSPDTVLLPTADRIALDILRTNGTVWPNDYVFAAAGLGPTQLFGLNAHTYAGTATFVCDSRALGRLFVSPVSLARFEENSGSTNTASIRLEGHAAFGLERALAGYRIAFS